MRNPAFNELLHKMREMHERKNHDYAQEGNPYSNFMRAAQLASWFTDPVDRVFATLIGVKLARLAELLSGKQPKNESIADTFLDLTVYSALWTTYRKTTYEDPGVQTPAGRDTEVGS